MEEKRFANQQITWTICGREVKMDKLNFHLSEHYKQEKICKNESAGKCVPQYRYQYQVNKKI
jgi:hypothetical protein